MRGSGAAGIVADHIVSPETNRLQKQAAKLPYPCHRKVFICSKEPQHRDAPRPHDVNLILLGVVRAGEWLLPQPA